MTGAAGRGTTTIADKAVRRIAEKAASEVLPAPSAGTATGSARVHGRTADVALHVALPYPTPLSETTRRVQQHVAERTRELTGLEIAPPRLAVTRLSAQGAAPVAPDPLTSNDGPPTRGPRRWWSARRAPTAVLVLLAAAACAAVTVDVIRVHAGGHRAAEWRLHTVDWFAAHRFGDLGVTVGAAVGAVVGLWLLAQALTPGRRGRLTVSGPTPRHNVAVDRSTVAELVRGAVHDVPGIETLRVRVGRRRLTVRARLAFGDQQEALRQATAATDRILAGCRLRRTLRHRVSVTPEPTWQSPPPETDNTPDEPEGHAG
ncbi:DUF6286 domain-containing protein [Streptomyces sp. NPDC058623]|uniref:DUF6286 domain-containing protein n=1 Tax=Streptomyces sp. NPDC058623 TaxID=3346563 RepID=UPI00364E54BC